MTMTAQHLKLEKRQDNSQTRLMDMLATALGPKIKELLDDPDIVEIMLNADGALWVERLGKGRINTGFTVKPADAEQVIYLVASSTGVNCNRDMPLLSAELPGCGSRFQGILPKVVSAPVFTIRKKAIKVFTLDDYVEQSILPAHHQKAIVDAIYTKKNILVVGGTGSGKTTLANAILNEIAKTNDRIVIIEDTIELQCTAPDAVFLRTREQENVTMNDLLKATMRLRPDRIVVGEVRGKEALTLLKAWSTGHPGGCATAHANSAKGGLKRLEQLVLETPDMSNPQKELIAEAVNLIIYIERYGHGRKIKEIAYVDGFEKDYLLRKI